MKVGIAADHGGYQMKQKIYILLGAIGHQVVDFGNCNTSGTTTIQILPFRLRALSRRDSSNAGFCSVAAA